MTPEKQRIAIAEACGWKDIQNCTCKIEWVGTLNGETKHLPSYLTDTCRKGDRHSGSLVMAARRNGGGR